MRCARCCESVAVLCPGPSLLKHRNTFERFPLKIGVNRAPVILQDFRCDWWCAADHRLIETPEYQPSYPIQLFTMAESAKQLKTREPSALFEDVFDRFGHEGKWECFSATAALILAADLGAKVITVFGADMVGTADADGHEYANPNLRNEWRWENEREKWRLTCELLSHFGVEAVREI